VLGFKKKKVIVKLKGGLGNQLFQYAIGKFVSLKFEMPLYFDLSSFNSDKLRTFSLNVFASEFGIYEPKMEKKHWYNLLINAFYKTPTLLVEENFKFDPTVFERIKSDTMLDGYWQSEKYFESIRASILNEITIQSNSEAYLSFHKQIISANNAIFIHVRRGDYISNPETLKFHGVKGLDYYKTALTKLRSSFNTSSIFIFSDDIEYVKNNFTWIGDYAIIDGNLKDYEELMLMSECKHAIIANSSFSWWGAWLIKNPNKLVIAPERWFEDEAMHKQSQDIIPASWMKI
jgi:hypothetical protein